MARLRKTINAHPQQAAFLRSPAPYRAFIGGRGAGKSHAGSEAAIIEAGKYVCTGMAVAPTYPNLRDYVIPAFLKAAGGALVKYNKADHDAYLVNGSKVLFRSADKPDSLRGPNLSWAWLDEARDMAREVWDIIQPALREGGRMGRMWVTTTPRGKSHWTYEEFVRDASHNHAVYQCGSAANPFIPQELLTAVQDNYGVGAWARQELEGEFVDPEGALFQRSDFELVDAVPSGLQLVRSWDLAVSTKTSADYTVGALLGEDTQTNTFYLLDLYVLKAEWPDVRRAIINTAQSDGTHVPIVIERVAFQLAAIQELQRERALNGHILEESIPDRDKVSRALPFASKARAGRVRIKRAKWNAAWLDEATSFTGDGSGHDDMVDAVSQAYAYLATAITDCEVLAV